MNISASENDEMCTFQVENHQSRKDDFVKDSKWNNFRGLLDKVRRNKMYTLILIAISWSTFRILPFSVEKQQQLYSDE